MNVVGARVNSTADYAKVNSTADYECGRYSWVNYTADYECGRCYLQFCLLVNANYSCKL